MTEEINFYSNKKDYGWMSNFYRATIIIDGEEYPTTEHYYQSQKAETEELRRWIASAPTPYLAAMAGRALRAFKGEISPSLWDRRKDTVMMTALRCKFNQNDDLRAKLLATGDAVLHEDSPNDMYWGKKGQDKLGKFLMQLRDEYRGQGSE